MDQMEWSRHPAGPDYHPTKVRLEVKKGQKEIQEMYYSWIHPWVLIQVLKNCTNKSGLNYQPGGGILRSQQ